MTQRVRYPHRAGLFWVTARAIRGGSCLFSWLSYEKPTAGQHPANDPVKDSGSEHGERAGTPSTVPGLVDKSSSTQRRRCCEEPTTAPRHSPASSQAAATINLSSPCHVTGGNPCPPATAATRARRVSRVTHSDSLASSDTSCTNDESRVGREPPPAGQSPSRVVPCGGGKNLRVAGLLRQPAASQRSPRCLEAVTPHGK